MILGILLFDYFETDDSINIWSLISLWLFLVYLWMLKVAEETRQYIEIGSRILTKLTFFDKIKAYFYDFWNYIDVSLIISYFLFLATSVIQILKKSDKLITGSDHDQVSERHKSLAVLAVVMCSVNFAKISKYGAHGVPVIDATVVMMKAFFKYLAAISPVIFGMLLSTFIVSDHEEKFENFVNMSFSSMKSMAVDSFKDGF